MVVESAFGQLKGRWKSCAEWDLSMNPAENNKRSKEELHDLLHLTKCRGVANANKNASIIQDCLTMKFWEERERVDGS